MNSLKYLNTFNSPADLMALQVIVVLFLLFPKALDASSSTTSKDIMNGIEFKISGYNVPPFFTMKKLSNGNYSYEGVVPDMILLYAEYFNMTIKYVNVDPREEEQFHIIRALLRQLDRKEVDFAPYTFEMILENIEHMELSFPFYVDQVTLLQPWPAEESRLKVTIRPFDFIVWICFFLSTLAFVGVTSVFIIFRGRENNPIKEIVYKQFNYVMSIITSQGYNVDYSVPTSYRILVSAWLLAMVVLIYAYAGVLTSMLTVPKLDPTINTLGDLAANDAFQITIEKGTIKTWELLKATSGPHKILGDSLRKDETLLFNGYAQMLDNVLHRKCVYYGTKTEIFYLVSLDFKTSGQCRLTTASKSIPTETNFYLYGMPKGSIYSKIMDEHLAHRIQEAGMLPHMTRKYYPYDTKQCDANAPPESKTRPLKLIDLAATFFILGIGLVLSVCSFVVEITFWHLTKKYGKPEM